MCMVKPLSDYRANKAAQATPEGAPGLERRADYKVEGKE